MSTEPLTNQFMGLAIPSKLTDPERRSLLAGGLGWMLDSMDVMLYSMVLTRLMSDLGMTKATAGFLNSLTLLSSAIGGIAFGFLADRVGRVRSMMVSILLYSLAIVAVWVRAKVPEPKLWTERAAGPKKSVPLAMLLRPDILRHGSIATTMNAFTMFGYWGLFTWIPAYLSLPVAQGGRGLGLMATTTWLITMGVGKWFGYATYGLFADQIGRRRTYAGYLIVASVLVPFYG